MIGWWLAGVKRTVSAPAVLLGVFLVTVAMALPLALALRAQLDGHLGASLAAAEAADAVNFDWWQEFLARAEGLGRTFTPSIIGFAAVLHNVGGLLDARPEVTPVAGALGAYLLVSTFLQGGIIDRLARQRPTRAHGFFAACGVFFFRFLRLSAAAGLAYGALFLWLHPWLFDGWYRAAIRDVNVERTAFLWRMGFYLLFGAALMIVNLLFDYARIRAVVEDRRSMLAALAAAARFVRRHPRTAAGLYGLNLLAFLLLLALWAAAAPGATAAGLTMWAAFAAGQAYLLARVFLKLTFLASQTAFFQASLAHAGYTAAPVAAWPESPAAELIPKG